MSSPSINEKGMVASAAGLEITPAGLAEEAKALLASVGRSGAQVTATADRAQALVERVQAALGA